MDSPNLQNQISEEFFYGRGTDIAKELLGKFLVNEETGCGGIIVETEAYLGEHDPSCHFAKSGEKRKKIFRKGAGTVYVYKIHTHDCMNIISEYKGNPEGILIRAIKPTKGIEEMKERRGWSDKTKLASGPGKLTEALGITKEEHNGEKLSESPITIYNTDLDPEIEISSRIGISKAEDWPARFSRKHSSYVSKPINQTDTSFSPEEYYQKFE
jgi:DNA-3-methyladenine glycosylase